MKGARRKGRAGGGQPQGIVVTAEVLAAAAAAAAAAASTTGYERDAAKQALRESEIQALGIDQSPSQACLRARMPATHRAESPYIADKRATRERLHH